MPAGSNGARFRRSLKVLSAAGLAAGAVMLAGAASLRLRAAAWQESNAGRFEARRSAGPPRPGSEARPSAGERSRPRLGRPMARLRIDRLGLDTVVAEGTDDQILSRGPGHLRGSGLPGERDNCIIAGHRDGAFARLEGIREGDLVDVADDGGPKRYRVVRVEVVDKDDAAVLSPTDRPTLTLVTCYPFRYPGPAPRRLVVRGELVEGLRPS